MFDNAVVPDVPALELTDIQAARRLLGDRVLTTPVHEWEGPMLAELLGPDTRVFLKLELFQRTGSFKARGALLNMLRLTREELGRALMTDPKLIGFQFQMSTYNSGMIAAEYFAKYPTRFFSMHVQDLDIKAGRTPVVNGRGGGYPQTPVGKGGLDWAATFAAARKAGGIKNYFVEQAMPMTIESVAALKAMVDEATEAAKTARDNPNLQPLTKGPQDYIPVDAALPPMVNFGPGERAEAVAVALTASSPRRGCRKRSGGGTPCRVPARTAHRHPPGRTPGCPRSAPPRC